MSRLTSRWRSVQEMMWDVLYKETGLRLARYQLFTLKLKPEAWASGFSMSPYLSFIFNLYRLGNTLFLHSQLINHIFYPPL